MRPWLAEEGGMTLPHPAVSESPLSPEKRARAHFTPVPRDAGGAVSREEHEIGTRGGAGTAEEHATACCDGCGAVFTPRRPWQRHCSARCRAAVSRTRETERRAEMMARVLPDDPGRVE